MKTILQDRTTRPYAQAHNQNTVFTYYVLNLQFNRRKERPGILQREREREITHTNKYIYIFSISTVRMIEKSENGVSQPQKILMKKLTPT